MNFLLILAQGEAAAPSGLQQLLGSPIMMILPMIILFYFMIWRPQSQQRKKLAERIANMKKGDKVVTNGGIHGVVNHKGDTTCSIRVSDGVFITMENANISTVTPKGSAKDSESSEKKEN